MADGARSDHPAVQQQLDRLSLLARGGDTLGLERIEAVLEHFGNPQDKLPPIFHVAGTNGKGSTCAFLRAAIEAEGLTCHVYTSPHLVRFNERIRIAGSLIEDEYLADILARVLDKSENICPTFFETTTVAAILAFTENPADACILETGVGGRLDATNIISNPSAAAICSLGIDHKEFLLDPIEPDAPTDPLCRIAWKKAGIAKKYTPLLTQKYEANVAKTIEDHANSVGAQYLPRGKDWDAVTYENQLHYRDEKGKIALPLPRMEGPHQADNAALAIAMLRHQNDINISDSSLAGAMAWAEWPARLQKLAVGPLTDLAPGGSTIWLDGGHNADAGKAIAAKFDGDEKPIHLIIGMLANKEPSAIIEPLAHKLASIAVVPIEGHNCHSIESFRPISQNLEIKIVAMNNVERSLDALPKDKPLNILVSGSLYLAGDVLAANNQRPD